MRKHKRKSFRKALAFILSWGLVWLFMAGSEITINYNKVKAQKARKTTWTKILTVARNIGDFRRAIWQ